MTQITINVEDESLVSSLKKVLNAIKGVSVVEQDEKSDNIQDKD